MAELFDSAFSKSRSTVDAKKNDVTMASISNIETILASSTSGHNGNGSIQLSSIPVKEQGSLKVGPHTIGNKENSVAIQPLTKIDTVWKGDEWSIIPVRVKIHSSFLNLFDQANRRDLILICTVESARSGTLFGRESKNVDIVFQNELCEKNKVVHTVDDAYGHIRPTSKIDVSVHNSCFATDDYFFVRIDVASIKDRPIPKDLAYFGRTQPIRVARYTLSLTQKFTSNKNTIHLADEYYAWFSKNGGGSTGLEADVAMLDEDGSTVKHYACKVPLVTQLIYSDGIPAPERIVNAKANLRGKSAELGKTHEEIAQKLQLFHELSPYACLGPGKTSQKLLFRIEEVSFHHAAHAGFKIRVSIADSGQMNVRPAILKESIVVLSKPRASLLITGPDTTKTEKIKRVKVKHVDDAMSSKTALHHAEKSKSKKRFRPVQRGTKRKTAAATKKAPTSLEQVLGTKAVFSNDGADKTDCTDTMEQSEANVVSESSFVTDESELMADANGFDFPQVEGREKCKGCGRIVTLETFFCEESHEAFCYVVAGTETSIQESSKKMLAGQSQQKNGLHSIDICMSFPAARSVSSDQHVFRSLPTFPQQQFFSPFCSNAPTQQHSFAPQLMSQRPSEMYSPIWSSASQQHGFPLALESQVTQSAHVMEDTPKIVGNAVSKTMHRQANAKPCDATFATPDAATNSSRPTADNTITELPERLLNCAYTFV